MADTVLSGNFAADGSSAILDLTSIVAKGPRNDRYTLVLNGNDGGGTTVLEVAEDDPPTNWVTDQTIGSIVFQVSYPFQTRANHVRVTLSGATAPDLNYKIYH